MITTAIYMSEGELDLSMPDEMCAVATLPLLIAAHIPVMFYGYDLLDAIRTIPGRRGAYMLIVLPLVLWSFIFSSIADGFVPSFLFGFPVFLLVAVLLPVAALYVRRDIMTTITEPMRARLACRRCGAPLAMHPTDRFTKCRWCREYNSNPFGPSMALEEMMAQDPEQPPTESGADR